MKEYKITIEYEVLIVIFLILLTAGSFPPYVTVRDYIFPVFCVIVWFHVLTVAFEVKLTESDLILCKTIIKTKIIKPAEITKTQDGILTFSIYHNNTSTGISTLLNGAYGLKRQIESLNSEIEIENYHLEEIEKLEKKNPLIILLQIFGVLAVGFLFKYIWLFI